MGQRGIAPELQGFPDLGGTGTPQAVQGRDGAGHGQAAVGSPQGETQVAPRGIHTAGGLAGNSGPVPPPPSPVQERQRRPGPPVPSFGPGIPG